MGTVISVLKLIPGFADLALKIIPFKLTKKHRSLAENQKLAYETSKKHAEYLLRVTNTKIVVSGEENIPQGVPKLFMGNHQSYTDVLVGVSIINEPVTFIGKKELEKLPVYSFWMREWGCLFLDREDPRAALTLFNEAAKRMIEEGISFVIYPEGTRSRSSKVNEIHKGSFKLAEKAKCPIVPVVIDGAYKILEEDNRINEHQLVNIVYLPPIYLDQLSREEAKVIHVTLRQQMEDTIHELHQKRQ